MRAVLGLLLIMLGLAMAVVWMPEHHGERQLAVVTDIATQGSSHAARKDGAAANGGVRTFSPHTPLLAMVETPGARGPALTAGVARVTNPFPQPPQTGIVSTVTAGSGIVTGSVSGAGTATAVVTSMVASGTVVPVTRAGNDDGGSAARAAATISMPRDELIRNLQRELKRVGCYHGEIDGDWGTGSRRAMGLFTDRVNATLPVDQPDFILLTLIRGHADTACGKSCPSGQTMSDSGRCMPNAVVAQARRGSERRGSNREPERDVAQSQAPSQSPANSQIATQSIARAETTTGWTTNLRQAGRATSIETEAVVAAAAGAAAAAVAPLPGRMAMRGPQSGGGAFIVPPPASLPAGDAVRAATIQVAPPDTTAADNAERAAMPPRGRGRRTVASARRTYSGPNGSIYAYRDYTPPRVVVYRASRSFAAAGPARRPARSWTGSFFGTP